jgi:late competence protein required for DNA uptake (superfamily II DNA/RNA helicase)
MFITRDVEIIINQGNFSYYEEMGYEVFLGETIRIPIELLSSGSQYKMSCKCDGCGITKEVMFKNYLKYGNDWGEYYCRKCSEIKRKETLQKNWGVDYPVQNSKISEKRLETLKKSPQKKIRKKK